MTVSEVLALLDAERDERGMSNWEKLGSITAGMRSCGIGLTRLRKLAKRIGRNRELAHALWKTDVYEARVIAILVDDPARITRDQAEKQVKELAGCMLAYVSATGGALILRDLASGSEIEMAAASESPRRPTLSGEVLAWQSGEGSACLWSSTSSPSRWGSASS